MTLKDINWNERCSAMSGYGMMLTPIDRHVFEKTLALDSALLRELDIMDYSLLLGIVSHKRNYEKRLTKGHTKISTEGSKGSSADDFESDSLSISQGTSVGRRNGIKKSLSMMKQFDTRSKTSSLGQNQNININSAHGYAEEYDGSLRSNAQYLDAETMLPTSFLYWSADHGGLSSDTGWMSDHNNDYNNNNNNTMESQYTSEIYYLSVIDILQEFDLSKRMENKWKSLQRKEHLISAVNSSLYAQRFFQYIAHRCLGKQSVQTTNSLNIDLSETTLLRLKDCVLTLVSSKGYCEDLVEEWRRCPTPIPLLIKPKDYACTTSVRKEGVYSMVELAPDVFRTLRNTFGYRDEYFRHLMSRGFIQESSQSGLGFSSSTAAFKTKSASIDVSSGTRGTSNTSKSSLSSDRSPKMKKTKKMKPLSNKANTAHTNSSPNLKYPENTPAGSAMGTSDQFFCEIASQRICVKSVSDVDSDVFLHSLDSYCQYLYVLQNSKHYPHSNVPNVPGSQEQEQEQVTSVLPATTLLPRVLGILKQLHVYDLSSERSIDASSAFLYEQMFPTLNTTQHGTQNVRTNTVGRSGVVTLLKTISLKGSQSKNRTVKQPMPHQNRTATNVAPENTNAQGVQGVQNVHAVQNVSGEEEDPWFGLPSGPSLSTLSLPDQKRLSNTSTNVENGSSSAVIIPHLLDLDFDQDGPLRMTKSASLRFLSILTSDVGYLKQIGAMNYVLSIQLYRCANLSTRKDLMLTAAETNEESQRQHLGLPFFGAGRLFEHSEECLVYCCGLERIDDRWEGSKMLSFLSGKGKSKRTAINPKDYAKRMVNFVTKRLVQEG